ncbi:MAG: ion channel [Flavipsychrobacter sp.]
MANQFRRKKLKNINNTGFTNNSNVEGGRLTNKDGSINVQKTGRPFWERISMFHTLLRMPWWKFLLSIFAVYFVINLVFATLYVVIGVHNLTGIAGHADDLLNGFEQAFFFSAQTLTTVGYGHISPLGLAANVVASIESFVGILSFALVTGLLYGRFARPQAFMMFSDNVLVAPHKGKRALMVRLATYKNNHITDVEAIATMAMHMREADGRQVTRFFRLELEITKIASMALSWTLVHLIDEKSPLFGMGHDEIMDADIEILYNMKGFDDHFSNIVQQRTSYTVSEMVYGAKFLPMFHKSDDGNTTVLELDKINLHERVDVPEPVDIDELIKS